MTDAPKYFVAGDRFHVHRHTTDGTLSVVPGSSWPARRGGLAFALCGIASYPENLVDERPTSASPCRRCEKALAATFFGVCAVCRKRINPISWVRNRESSDFYSLTFRCDHGRAVSVVELTDADVDAFQNGAFTIRPYLEYVWQDYVRLTDHTYTARVFPKVLPRSGMALYLVDGRDLVPMEWKRDTPRAHYDKSLDLRVGTGHILTPVFDVGWDEFYGGVERSAWRPGRRKIVTSAVVPLDPDAAFRVALSVWFTYFDDLGILAESIGGVWRAGYWRFVRKGADPAVAKARYKEAKAAFTRVAAEELRALGVSAVIALSARAKAYGLYSNRTKDDENDFTEFAKRRAYDEKKRKERRCDP